MELNHMHWAPYASLGLNTKKIDTFIHMVKKSNFAQFKLATRSV